MSIEKFNNLVDSKDLNKVVGTGFDLEWRLFNRLPQKYVDAYKYDYAYLVSSEQDEDVRKQKEWILRGHLIVDYLSGMTDNFVIETYNLLYGIKI
ncbi:MAG: hypothetical protein IPI46_14245 [Bacteroidetes bacterium]|nr:hypothetical protein [Bacteroidota bacterium]